MRRAVSVVVLLTATLLVAAYLALPYLSSRSGVRTWAQRFASTASGLDVQLQGLRIGYDLSVAVDGIRVAERGRLPFVEAEDVVLAMPWAVPSGARYRLGPLRTGGLEVYFDRFPSLRNGGRGAGGRQISLNARVHTHRDSRTIDLGERGLILTNFHLASTAFSTTIERIEAGGSVSLDAEGWSKSDLRISASGVSLHDTPSLRVADKVALRASAQVTVDENGVGCRCAITIDRGEVLWDRTYLNLSRFQPHAEGLVRIPRDHANSLVREAHLEMKGLGSWSGRVELNPVTGVYSISGSYNAVDAGKIYEILLRDPYEETYPLLSKLHVGGTLSGTADLSLDNATGFRLRGRAHLRNGVLQSDDPAFAGSGIHIDLPLNLGGRDNSDSDERGSFAIDSLDAFGTHLSPLHSTITTRTNSLTLTQEMRTEFFGGTLSIGPLSASQLLDGVRLKTSMKVDGVDVARLGRALGLAGTAGTIEGTLTSIIYADKRIDTRGGLSARIFGGRVDIDKLSARELFSRVPALGLDLSFSDIRLADLTSALEIGRISGVIRGSAKNLVLVDGQPVSMDLEAATTPRRGVPQTISVTALDQISILGGSGSNRLTRGLFGFFDHYRYAKMGLVSHLSNDRFTLTGVDQYDGKQFLVVGSFFPPTVNVISRNRVIGFSDMVRRLKRVRRAGTAGDMEGTEK